MKLILLTIDLTNSDGTLAPCSDFTASPVPVQFFFFLVEEPWFEFEILALMKPNDGKGWYVFFTVRDGARCQGGVGSRLRGNNYQP